MFLDHLTPEKIESSFFGTLGNLTEEKPVSVNEQFYEHSICVSGRSIIKYKIDHKLKHFNCYVGLHDESDDDSCINFEIYLDGILSEIAPNVTKNQKIRRLSINIYGANTLTLVTENLNKRNSYPVWIDPILSNDYEISVKSASNRLINYLQNKKQTCSKCIISICDAKSVKILDNLWSSIILNSNLKDYKFVLLCNKNEIHCFESVIKTFDPIIVNYDNGFKNNIWLKYALYNIAQVVDCKFYLYLDIDMIVLSDLNELFEKANESSEHDLFFVRESNNVVPKGTKLGEVLCNNKMIYFSDESAKFLLKINEKEYNYDFIINAGLILGNKKGFLGLNNILKSMSLESSLWLDQKKDVDWREQGVVNLAMCRYNRCGELPQKFNFQMLTENAKILETKNNLKAYCAEKNQEISILHFNGDKGKEKFKKYNTKFSSCQTTNDKAVELILNKFDLKQPNAIKMYSPIDFEICYSHDLLIKQEREIELFESFTKTYLEDTTFIIPVRIDNEKRLKNLKFTIQNLNYHFENKVIIAELDFNSKINFEGNFDKILFKPDKKFFDRNKMMNELYQFIDTKYIFINECDVILNPLGIVDCYNKLKSNLFQFCLPFNGIPIWLNESSSVNYYDSNKLPVVWKHVFGIENLLDESFFEITKVNCKHLGFSYMLDYETFKSVGLENENFRNWGYEDLERVARFVKFGNKVYHSNYYCYHLWHPRSENKKSWYEEKSSKENFNEFRRICEMTKDDLISEIKSWPWNK